jgi:hypothetical protein
MKAPARPARVLGCGVLAALVVGCASGTDDGTDTPDGSTDARDATPAVDATGPAPDAIVLAETGAPEAEVDAPVTGKSCEGLPDGTPCGPASECYNEPVCAQGQCAAPTPNDGITCGGGPTSCTTQSTCAGGQCMGTPMPNGTVCAPTSNVCQTSGTCDNGTCGAIGNVADGTVCAQAPDACHTAGTCKSGKCGAVGTEPDGTNWKSGDSSAICCGGNEVEANTDTNCGACGIACNSSNGESCSLLGTIYFCRGCESSSGCWSKCCSESFTPYSCAASDCDGNCSSQYCPAGTHCVDGSPNSSDYCSY